VADASKIEWTDSTFNPWVGCTKVSPACDHCYAQTLVEGRFKTATWGAGQPRVRTTPANWRKPLRWNAQPFAQCDECGWRGERRDFFAGAALASNGICPGCGALESMLDARRRVFCASLADVFDNEVDPAWRADLFALIRATPNLDWLLLTKRIGNADRMIAEAIGALPRDSSCGTGQHNHTPLAQWPWPNVWLGATVCDQAEADRDIPKLLAVPAAVRFLSVEPMLEAVDIIAHLPAEKCRECGCPESAHGFHRTVGCQHVRIVDGDQCICGCRKMRGEARHTIGMPYARHAIDWVIYGGESGPNARPMHPDWPRALRDQCAAAGVPFLFKQWGEWRPINQGAPDWYDQLYRSNRKAREGEDQARIDDVWGRTCAVPTLCLRHDGKHVDLQSPMAFQQGTAPVMAFRVGKKAAGRLLDGRTHDGVPDVST
jgi:protein gp37